MKLHVTLHYAIRLAIASLTITALSGFSQFGSAGPVQSTTIPKPTPAQCEKYEAIVNSQTPARQKTLLGSMYAEGMCRPPDRERGLTYLREAARLGDNEASYTFFVVASNGLKANGLGHQQALREYKEGVGWLQKSAKSGNWKAASVLGSVCYKFGACSLPRDPKLAHYWCQRYSELVPPEAIPKHSDCYMKNPPTAQTRHK